jgi:hypothetical protein
MENEKQRFERRGSYPISIFILALSGDCGKNHE